MPVNRNILLQKLPPYLRREKIISQHQGVYDIMKEIGKSHSLFAADYEKIASFFDTGNLETTCKKLFQFCKLNIKYAIESEDKQSTRSPAAIVAMGKDIGGDCKHYASFIAGVLDAIRRTTDKKINWEYRFSSYRIWDSTPHHVFCVVTLPDGREIWIDPVLNIFDEKKLYSSAITKNVNTMPLVRMSGIESQVIGKTQKKIAKQAKKAADKAAGVKKPGILKKIVKVVKKVSVAPARNAFLALVGLNVHGMATKLLKTTQDPARKAKLKEFWETKLAGSYSALEGTFIKGAKKKKILGFDENAVISGASVGVVQVAAVLAAAAPIIAALAAFLKGGGGEEYPELDAAIDAATETIKEDVLATGTPQNVPVAPGESGTTATPPINAPAPVNNGQTVYRNSGNTSSAQLMTAEEIEAGDVDSGGGSAPAESYIKGVPNMALFAGAGLLLYMATKKR